MHASYAHTQCTCTNPLFFGVYSVTENLLCNLLCAMYTHTRTLYAHVHNYCIVIMYLCLGAIWIKEVCFGRTNFYRIKYVLVIRPPPPPPRYSFSVHFILWHVDPLLWCHPFGALHSVEIIPFFGACGTVACSIDPLLWCHPFGACGSVVSPPLVRVALWHAV